MAKAAIFASGKSRKSSNEAPESVVRKIGMIVELLRHQRICFSRYAAQYDRDYRSFQRDLQQLRKIGVHAGFKISQIRDNEFVELLALDKKTRNLRRGAERAERLTATIAQSLGEPIVRELGSGTQPQGSSDDFFAFASPQLIEGTAVADICTKLHEAQASPSGRAAVRFRMPALVRHRKRSVKSSRTGLRFVRACSI